MILNMAEFVGDVLLFEKVRVQYSVSFRERKHMAISVHPDSRITVAAPVGTSLTEVERRMRKRAPWILKQLERFERFHPLPTPRTYVSGETHRYLGRQYRLKIVKDSQESVKLLGRYLVIRTKCPSNSERTQQLVDGWYRTRARDVFHRRLEVCLGAMRELNGVAPPLTIRKMRARWGSCSKSGRILLNVELVRAPVECIDYVITHELCHLKVPDHSPKFYRLLSRFISDWDRRKRRLEAVE